MLKTLRLQNVALIREVEIEFGAGLNVLTGETGAGKSIIVGSFNFLLGAKSDKSIIRTGVAFARVDAVFDNVGDGVKTAIEELVGMDWDGDSIIISRTIKTDGRGDCRINGAITTNEILKTAVSLLLNIHGQHDTEVLIKPKNHVAILDGFGGAAVGGARNGYNAELEKLRAIEKSLKQFGGTDAERKRQTDIYKFQIDEIEKANLKIGEDEDLADKKARMQNFEKIATQLGDVVSALDGEGGAAIKSLSQSLSGVSHLDAKLSAFFESAKSIRTETNELLADVQEYLDGMEFDEAEFKKIDGRLDEIRALKRKYGANIGEILTFLKKTRAEYDFLTQAEQNVEKIKAEIEKQTLIVHAAGEKLVLTRKTAAEKFEKHIISGLCDLGMQNSRFICTDITVDGATFLFSANVGQAPKPLANIISGGEMSRFMLALKSVTAAGACTLVFDEIDTGISGIMGHKIAEKMKSIASGVQVIAVTHLAQIASVADTHFLISKRENAGDTITEVLKLDGAKRRGELARMVGGGEFVKNIVAGE